MEMAPTPLPAPTPAFAPVERPPEDCFLAAPDEPVSGDEAVPPDEPVPRKESAVVVGEACVCNVGAASVAGAEVRPAVFAPKSKVWVG